MRTGRDLRLAIRALLAHKLRAALGVASVAIGVAAVLVTSAVGEGARHEVLGAVEAMGSHLLVVRAGQVGRSLAHEELEGRVSSLRLDDWRAIAALAPVAAAAPGLDQGMRVRGGRGSMRALVFGTSPSFFTLRRLRIEAGRGFDTLDNESCARVAVLGARIASTLYPGREPVGQTIRVRDMPFEVVGVLAERGTLADGSDEDGNVFVPIRTALRRVLNTRGLASVFVSATAGDRIDEAKAEIRRLLRDRHRLGRGKPDDFEIQNQAKLLTMRQTLADSLRLLAGGLAGVSLVVGGAGVMALMRLSVKERTSEIGLRMALGARRRDVFYQFLTEALLLTWGGWIVGVGLGAAAATAAALTTDWPVAIPTSGILATLGTSVLTGVGFGALPARKAARLPPIQALRAS